MTRKAVTVALALMLGFTASVRSLWHTAGREDYVAAALGQSRYRLDIAVGRGAILDCHEDPLVDRETRVLAAIAPTEQGVGRLDQATGGRYRLRLREALEDGKPFLLEADPVTAGQIEGLPGVTLFRVPRRLSAEQPAVQLIGQTDTQGQGISGVELALEDVLGAWGGELSATYPVDALGRVPAGGRPEVENTLSPGAGVSLTLDLTLQRLAEEEGAALGKGAVVITEVPGCEIRAMASFPTYSPEDLAHAVDDPDSPLLNRALCAYAPGSVFKLAVAAAALERGIPPEHFRCTGSLNADGLLFHCYGGRPHGEVDLRGALTHSCNCYFISLGRSLGGQPLLSMAYDLGLGQAQEFGRGLFTDSGTLPAAEELENLRALANTSFGQGAVTVTPLQLCGLVNAIAARGVYHSPRLLAGLVDSSGRVSPVTSSADREVRVMKESTARILQSAMAGVAREGTGQPGDPGVGWVALKTGTAQTGVFDGDRELLHFWYCGMVGPAPDQPRYCVTVLAESTPDDEGAAARVFRETARRLMEAMPS